MNINNKNPKASTDFDHKQKTVITNTTTTTDSKQTIIQNEQHSQGIKPEAKSRVRTRIPLALSTPLTSRTCYEDRAAGTKMAAMKCHRNRASIELDVATVAIVCKMLNKSIRYTNTL